MASDTKALSDADIAVLENVARRVVDLRMEVPAILTIESTLPLSVLAGQAMHFFQPIVQALFRMPDYQRFAQLVERREALEKLMSLIEARADVVDGERRKEAKARAAERKSASRR
jgi:hypothetical protein